MTEVVDVLVEAGAAVRSLKDAAGVGDIGGFLDGDVSRPSAPARSVRPRRASAST